LDVLRPPGMAPTRRAVLGGAALAALAGCTTETPAPPPGPGPQAQLLMGALQGEAALIALYDAVLAAHPGLRTRLGPLRDHHSRHLAVLRHHLVRAGAVPAPPRPPAVPAGQARALGALRTAEHRAAAARADEVRRAAPGLAQLLASIGACEAGHAQVLS
jgi:hypothetical protein